MSALASSDAIYTRERVLPQHQAALTLLQSRLGNPASTTLRWLDIACGRGQILASLQDNLSDKARGKVTYLGYDVSSEFVRRAKQQADTLHLGGVEGKVGDLSDFGKLVPVEPPFDFITFTNSAHEVAPASLAAVLVDAVLRLAPNGTLFLYDMESLAPHELGAIPWRRDEFKVIVRAMLSGLDCDGYEPEVGSWPHKTTNGWNAQIQREFMRTADLATRRDEAVRLTSNAFEQAMRGKLASCEEALEKLTEYGPENENEREEQTRLLFEFWSLSRALRSVT